MKLGGNAVIATDIDFSEVGSGNTNMLMVCMAGTAVKIRDFSRIDPTRAEKFEQLKKLNSDFTGTFKLSARACWRAHAGWTG